MKEYTVEIECPEGYKPVAVREVKKGDLYIDTSGIIAEAEGDTWCTFVIVEKIKPVERVFRLVSECGQPEIGQFVSSDEKSSLAPHHIGCYWNDCYVWEEVTNEIK
ncbi:MAG: hypothetical protein OEY89_14005 [Gammaproteobacteria bacterium]|nr:hypothetical protein [Gammaproteobacteria bacterium]